MLVFSSDLQKIEEVRRRCMNGNEIGGRARLERREVDHLHMPRPLRNGCISPICCASEKWSFDNEFALTDMYSVIWMAFMVYELWETSKTAATSNSLSRVRGSTSNRRSFLESFPDFNYSFIELGSRWAFS